METSICSVCAWRCGCLKKFSVSIGVGSCPDFTKDVSIGTAEQENKEILPPAR
ncbi:MAG: hypothetical protein L3V56_04440 [Candidatus Magnetoovum sp. WYHC-5]|nr:hypothetical protein [Candidatus Magnetoovum sp. WYHC-5]